MTEASIHICIVTIHTYVYSTGMANRLTREDWVQHGFDVLRTEGHEGLKADRMVKALNVTRGSFYWHFKSLKSFHAALLTAWRANITEAVIAELKEIPTGQMQLTELISRVILTPQFVEAAIRSWAQVSEEVAEAVRQVDEMRITYLAEVMKQQGVPADTARSRAVVLSWAYVGRAIAPAWATDLPPDTAADLGQLFLQTHDKGQA